MGLQLIPFAVGTAVGAAAAYIITDQRLRIRIADESMQIGRRISAYFTDPSTGDEQTESITAVAEQQASQTARQADQHRCEAMTKAGYRCRSKTHTVVSMSQGAAGATEVALCSVHNRIHQQGGTFALVGSSE